MKFELVEFYPQSKDFKPLKKPTGNLSKPINQVLGTCHIYAIEPKLDIRGIRIYKGKKGVFFRMPHYRTTNEDNKDVTYPVISWHNENDKNDMMKFLHEEVKKEILQRICVEK